jgi:hypothetical protein
VVREIQAGVEDREIPARLSSRFDDAHGVLERDVAALLAELRQKGLLES